MKNILNFYIIIFLPFVMLMLFGKYNLVGNYTWVILLLVYCLLYHPRISGLRLLANGIITKKQLLYNFIPTWNWKYFSFLFFNYEGYKHGK